MRATEDKKTDLSQRRLSSRVVKNKRTVASGREKNIGFDRIVSNRMHRIDAPVERPNRRISKAILLTYLSSLIDRGKRHRRRSYNNRSRAVHRIIILASGAPICQRLRRKWRTATFSSDG